MGSDYRYSPVPPHVLYSDRVLDNTLDALENEHGQPLNLARWDLKAALQEALKDIPYAGSTNL